MTNIIKIYIEKTKYNNKNNTFDYKLIIFNNLYFKNKIFFKIKIKLFFIIFKNLT